MSKKKACPKIAKIVDERSGGLCEICKSNDRVERHHIIGGSGKRLPCETEHSVIALCHRHHYGKEGVHEGGDRKFILSLKQNLEKTYRELGYDDEKVKFLMGGKYYLCLNSQYQANFPTLTK